VAKDFEWSFLALQVLAQSPSGDNIVLDFEKVEQLPLNYMAVGAQNLTSNLLLFKISLPEGTNQIGVNEFHQNRKEPFPKSIKVYEKQTVEVYESKYYLSVYPTELSLIIFKVNAKDIHFQSEAPSKSTGTSIEYGPYKDLEPITFE
jgi:oligosaccharyltransferase complex subunit alpha (ribophorin I)